MNSKKSYESNRVNNALFKPLVRLNNSIYNLLLPKTQELEEKNKIIDDLKIKIADNKSHFILELEKKNKIIDELKIQLENKNKEIIEDVDLTKIKQSITSEGDIFKAIANPDSGFSELFTNVSQKMSNKISSGELSQEAIMKDAMKFASILPGLFGGNTDESSNGTGGFDMSSIIMH